MTFLLELCVRIYLESGCAVPDVLSIKFRERVNVYSLLYRWTESAQKPNTAGLFHTVSIYHYFEQGSNIAIISASCNWLSLIWNQIAKECVEPGPMSAIMWQLVLRGHADRHSNFCLIFLIVFLVERLPVLQQSFVKETNKNEKKVEEPASQNS